MRLPGEDRTGWTDFGLLFLKIFIMIIPLFILIIYAIVSTEADFVLGVALFIIGSAGLIAIILPIWGAISNWRYHTRLLLITRQQYSILQDAIINKYLIDKRGRTKKGDTIYDDLWVISKGQKELDMNIFFKQIQKRPSNNRIWLAITIGPCTRLNHELVCELKSIVENIIQLSTYPPIPAD